MKISKLLWVIIAGITVLSLVSSLLMLLEPNGSLLNLSLIYLENSGIRNYHGLGFMLFIFISIPFATTLIMMSRKYKQSYNYTLAIGLLLSVLSGLFVGYFRIFFWTSVSAFMMGLLIILISLQLKGKEWI